jgi:hypothetical protein
MSLTTAPVYIHVYRLKDSDMGFYHTGQLILYSLGSGHVGWFNPLP